MLQARGLCFLLCLAGAVWAADEATEFSETGATGRGPRLMEHGAQTGCKQEQSWPFCADEDWGPKCPSGCRIQGLIDQTDRNFGKRFDNIRKQLTDNQNNYKSADVTTKETYELIKDNLVQGQDSDNKFGLSSEDLRRRIEELKLITVRNVNKIKSLHSSIQNQVTEIKRLEVDIDIKIRACKGSCSQGFIYNVDKESYDNIQKSLQQAGAINLDSSLSETNSLRILKMRPVKDTIVADHFKSLPHATENTQFNIFTEIEQKAMVLERQGKEVKGPIVDSKVVVSAPGSSTLSGSKVTVTKVEGGVPTGVGIEKQILAGDGDKSTTTVTSHGRIIKCTKTITKKITHGPDGPKEELIETMSGGEGNECAHLMSNLGTDAASGTGSGGTYNVRVTSTGNLDDLSKFPSLEEFLSGGAGSTFHTSSSSSSTKDIVIPGSSASGGTSSSKVIHTSYTGHDAFSDLDESGIDDFSNIHLGTPTFHSKGISSPGEGSSYTKTVVSSSSKSSPFETKTMKSGFVPEDLAIVQHDQHGDDMSSLRAGSVKTEVRFTEGATGTGKSK